MSRCRLLIIVIAATLHLGAPAVAQDKPAPVAPAAPAKPAAPAAPAAPVAPAAGREIDLGQPTLFVVGYAHLDTQWRWTYPQTIGEFLAHTLHDNFALIEKHPQYVFNFTGARRYEMFQEYYPDEFEKLKGYVAAGRWFPAGSSMDENDCNTPSGESLVRQVLYGNRWFRRELGTASEEYMLPDCFGFPYALPSVLAHCGIKGFSTQKLTWNSVVGIPFKVGVWEGPDGRSVVAALDPGHYDGDVTENLATSANWLKRINADGQQSGVFADFHYYGTGDVGGAPKEPSVAMVEQSLGTAGPIHVVAGPADAMFKAITPEMKQRLPHYKGELELTQHSAGSLTSEAAMKRWNRKNELLADAAERASVAAAWLGGRAYPSRKLEAAWTLVLGSQMHDIVSGTALAKGYEYAWNDELLAANQFAAIVEDATGVVASQLDTRGTGTPLVVFNPLSVERQDVVEAELPVAAGAYAPGPDGAAGGSVRVVGPSGEAVPAQILGRSPTSVHVAFVARVPSVGFAVYDAQLADDKATAAAASPAAPSALRVDERRLENERYVVTLNDDGDVASIHDKAANRELLSAPARLELHYENPENWPAWNQDWTDRQQPPREIVGGPAQFRVVERGPARVAVEVTRTCGASTFVQRIRLAAGAAGDRVEFDTDIGWAARERSLRASFPLAVSNPLATYDIQTGVIQRGNMHKEQYEYGFQQWFDLTDAGGAYGVTVASDSKFGSDKPDDGTLRLTLLHTPGTHGGYEDQGTQDIGRHHVVYALSGHAGDWRDGRSAIEAARLNQPPLVFRAAPHAGPLGKSFALMQVSDDAVRIQALKKAEDGDEVIVRLRELSGHAIKGVRVSASRPIVAAREVDGQERAIGAASVQDGQLVADIGGFELRAFAIQLGPPPATAPPSARTPLDVPFDTDVVSSNRNRGDGAMDGEGRTLPAEQLPATIVAEDATFRLGPTADGGKNALACHGQQLTLPAAPQGAGAGAGGFDRVYLLAAADGGPGPVQWAVDAQVQVDGKPVAIRVGNWTGYIGQWDHRLWKGDVPEEAYGWSNQLAGIDPGFVQPLPVAWFCSHVHTHAGDAFYQYCYLFKIAIDLPPGSRTLRLPDDVRIKVFAATAVSSAGGRVVAAAPLFDTLAGHVQDAPQFTPAGGAFDDAVDVQIDQRLYGRAGAIRYTLDGSEPAADSAVYTGPFPLARPAELKAAMLGRDGHLGPTASATIDVNDVTPPAVTGVAPSFGSPDVHVTFSEPVDDAATFTLNYSLKPHIDLRSARRGAGDRDVILTFASPPELDRKYVLHVAGVKDASPAHNRMKPVDVGFTVQGPVFSTPAVPRGTTGIEIRVPGLPVAAQDHWTVNLFVRADKQPDDKTVIAGFGRCEQAVDGAGRYMCRFPSGVQFWIHNRDVAGRMPFDVGRWQMLTATYDGRAVRLYKDGRQVGEHDEELADDENVVRIAPPDPWDGTRRFDGEIRDFTIWSNALSDDAIRTLLAGAPQD